jgi:GTPase SAR1 family protein
MYPSEILKYTPYESLLSNSVTLSDYKAHLEYKQLFEDNRHIIDLLLHLNYMKIMVLHGNSGTGKSTFVHQLRDKLAADEKRGLPWTPMHITCLKKNPTYTHPSKDVLCSAIGSELINYFTKGHELDDNTGVQALIELYAHHKDFLTINRIKPELIAPIISDTIEKSAIIKLLISIIDFLDSKSLIIFYCLFIILLMRPGRNNSNRIIFVFDNLDELSPFNLSASFYAKFYDAYRTVADWSSANGFNQSIKFLLVLRSANFLPASDQLRDMIEGVSCEVSTDMPGHISEVYRKRMKFASRLFSEGLFPTSEKLLVGLLNTIEADQTLSRTLSRLFNNDYRRLTQAIIDLNVWSNQPVNRWIYQLTHSGSVASDESIPKQGLHVTTIHMPVEGVRSLIYALFVYYLTKTGKIIGLHQNSYSQVSHCRPLRMLLSYVQSHRDDYRGQEQYTGVTMNEIYQKLQEWYPWNPEGLGLEAMRFLFTLGENRWARLISIDIEPSEASASEQFGFTEPSDKRSILADYFEACKQGDREKMNAISQCCSISITPSGQTYLLDLMTHFEYFSCSEHDLTQTMPEYKPLFMCIDVILIDGEFKFSFEPVVNRVFNRVKECHRQMSEFMQTTWSGGIKEFLKSSGVALRDKSSGEIKQSYSMRIVSQHVQFLDEFRYYIIHSELFDVTIRKHGQAFKEKALTRTDLNTLLVTKIRDYIELLGKMYYQQSGLSETYKELINKVETIEKAHYTDYFTRISTNSSFRNR